MEIISWILLCMALFLIIVLVWQLRKNFLLAQENKELAKAVHVLEEGYDTLSKMNDALHEERHNSYNQLVTLLGSEPNCLRQNLEELIGLQKETVDSIHTGDPYLDAILRVKTIQSMKANIRLEYAASLPGKLPLPPLDLCSIVANMLDNAIEASGRIPEEKDRWIHFTVDRKKDFILFIVTNSIIPGSMPKLSLDTTKKDPDHMHGVGIKSIRAAVLRNGGSLSHESTEDTFITRAMVQIPEKI